MNNVIYHDAFLETPEENEHGKFLVWFVPFGDNNAASWAFGFWNNSDKTWDVVNAHIGREDYKIEYWVRLPSKPIPA